MNYFESHQKFIFKSNSSVNVIKIRFKGKKHYKIISIVSLAASIGLLILSINFLIASGINFNADTNNRKETITGHGTVTYIPLEGGFFGIISDDGEHYDPINLPSEFQVDGLKIIFEAIIRDDLGSFHMWGKIIELINIQLDTF